MGATRNRKRAPLGASILLLVAVAGCAHHLKLGVPNAAIGGRYECETGGACSGLSEDDPSLSNPVGLTRVTLPTGCERRFDEIRVLNPGDDDPRVIVRCAGEEPADWVCRPRDDVDGCRSTGHLVLESEEHRTVTSLPAACGRSIYEIAILHAGRRSPRIIVTCAPPEQDGIPTMGGAPAGGE